MNANAIFKALSNEHRLQILLWLKTPEQHFAAERLSTAEETGMAGGVCVNAIVEKTGMAGGVCVNAIVEKTGLTQSVISTYLTVLKDAGLIRTERAGKWTYCFYRPETMAEFSAYLHGNFLP